MVEAKNPDPILEVRNLKKYFPITRGLLRRTVGQVKAVDGVSFAVPAGQTLGLVGESGCGKTTTGHCIMRGLMPTAGEILFQDPTLGQVDVARANQETLFQVRRNMQMVFQDPFASLNPRMTVRDIVAEPLVVNKIDTGKAVDDRVATLLRLVGLSPSYMRRFPHAFSGGQRQRIVIARALALNPKVIVADEPVSALDVSIQAQTLNLLRDLQEELQLAYLFIAHDLSVVQHISNAVAVMYVGRIVEMAETHKVYFTPKHPYTEALLSSVPRPDPFTEKARIVLQGEVPSPANPPAGCTFHPRCRYAQPLCQQQEPALAEVEPGHWVSCHFADELTLQGVAELTTR
ncbi:MAG: dipeptide ABC transporter ATP-binding protein [Caldilineaceae bacterium]|nr:dipeptide ABC transporter ATP-binding protein [Caldilineaceae bacterium]